MYIYSILYVYLISKNSIGWYFHTLLVEVHTHVAFLETNLAIERLKICIHINSMSSKLR